MIEEIEYSLLLIIVPAIKAVIMSAFAQVVVLKIIVVVKQSRIANA